MNLRFWITKQTAYDRFSQDFSQTRKTPLPEFSLFEKYLSPERKKKNILYIGCGNGRNIPLLQKYGTVTGIDASEQLLLEAKKNIGGDVALVHGDAACLPFAKNRFDVVVAFASLHHMTSEKKRKKAFSEAFRVLKPDGVFLGTVWNLHQKRFMEQKKNARLRALFLPWWRKNDYVIPWGQKKIPRMYHCFSVQSLENMLQKSGFRHVSCFSQKDMKKAPPHAGKNICFVAYKK